MTSSMIAHEDLITPLSPPDKPSIEGSTQLLMQSEHMPIVSTSRSSDLSPETQSTNNACTFADKSTISNNTIHQNLSFTSNPQHLNIDANPSKILSSYIDNSPTTSHVMSPPMLSESYSDSIQSSASIKGTTNQSKYIIENIKFQNEENLQLTSKSESNNQILLNNQNIMNLRDISTPSPPNVPYNTNESQMNQVKPELITMKNYIGENIHKMDGFDKQVSHICYQNGYSINNSTQDQIVNSNLSTTQYYGTPMQTSPLYAPIPQQNYQFLAPNQKLPLNAFVKQQKNLKSPKIQFQQMYMWQTQQQYSPYQYFRYNNQQIQPLNTNNYNFYNNYQQTAPLKGESTLYQQQNYGVNNIANLKTPIYSNCQTDPIQLSGDTSSSSLPYQKPNQEQQFLLIEDSHQISKPNLNTQISSQPISLNHDSTISSKMNLMMNYSSIKNEPIQSSLPKSETSHNHGRATKHKTNSSKSLLRTAHYIHHHHQTPPTGLVPPEPVYYNDKELGKYGIRCVCGKGSITVGLDSNESTNSGTKSKKSKKNKNKSSSKTVKETNNEHQNEDDENTNEPDLSNKNAPNSIKTTTLLIQCDSCHFWLHGLCVNIARIQEDEPYICPFCQNKQIFCTKCGDNMNYSNPLIKCTKCGYWVHKECEGLIFGINPQNFVCRNCGGLGEEATYDIPYANFLNAPKKRKESFEMNPNDISLLLNNNKNSNNNEENNSESDSLIDLDTFYDMQIPNKTVFVSPSIDDYDDNSNDCSRTQILDSIPEGFFKKMVIYDLNKSELEFRSTIEKYFHNFAPLLFDYSHEFWRIFKETLSKLIQCDNQVLLKSIDSLANHLIYMPTSHLSIKQEINTNENELENITYQSPRTKVGLFTNSESISKYLEGLNMTCIEKQPSSSTIYCDKNDGRIYTTESLDENTFICDIPGFLMHTDEVRVEEEGIPKTCFLVTDLDLVIDTKGTDFEYFAPRIRRGFHFNAVVKLVRIQGQIRLCLFAMKMKTLLSSEEKLKRGPAIKENGEIILPLDGTIPFPVKKIQWKDKKKHHKSANNNNDVESNKSNSSINDYNSNIDSINRNSKGFDDDDSENDNDLKSLNQSKNSNQSLIMTRNQEKRKKAEMKLERKNRDQQISKLSLLSSFYDDSVQTFPFILLDNDEAVEKYKSQMEMKASKSKNGKGKR